MRNEKSRRSNMGEALSDRLRSKGAWLIVCLLGFFLMGTYGSTPVKATENQVTFEKVQEKTYTAFIRGIAFGSVVKDGEEHIYCKVIVLEDKEVQFLDESGKIVSRKSLVATKPSEVGKYSGKTAILSGRGNFVAIHDYTAKSADAMNYIVEEEHTICNDRGEEIYRFEGPLEGTASGYRLLISDKDGSAVGARLEYGALDFYRPDGEVKTVHIFDDIGWGKSTGGSVVFSDDGEYLAVLVGGSATRPLGLRPTNTDVWAILFDRRGTELWRRRLDQDRFGNIAISPSGEYIFFKTYSFAGGLPRPEEKGETPKLLGLTLGLYDKSGTGLTFGDTSLFSFGSFCFSPQADYVALGGRDLIRLIKTEDGLTVFEKELPWSGRIRELLFSADGEYLIVKPETNPLFIVNMKGEMVWQHYFYSRVREIFSGNGFLAFSFPYRYEIFQKIEKER